MIYWIFYRTNADEIVGNFYYIMFS